MKFDQKQARNGQINKRFIPLNSFKDSSPPQLPAGPVSV